MGRKTASMIAKLSRVFWIGLFCLVAGFEANAQTGPCAVPIQNPIVCENSKTGNPKSEWDVTGAGSTNIQGFTTDISANKGGTVSFKVNTSASAYRLDIYRMGYYGGSGARKIVTIRPTISLPQSQPSCLSNGSTGLIDCGNWAVSLSWTVPSDAVSGIYFAKAVREDSTTGSSHIVFVVRDDSSTSDIFFQTADTTWQAYNQYGGNSLYVGSPAGRAYKVSYNRPITTRGTTPEDWVFNTEYPTVRWLESNGYNVSYTTGIDSDRRGNLILNHRIFLSVGHDEYWSAAQRTNVETARNAGVHLAFFSGNEVFWKTRWENSIDASGTPYRTLVSYKESMANAKIDPQANIWTGMWRDPRFSPPADGGRPENALTGTLFSVNAPASANDAIKVPSADGKMRFWRNTSIATLGSTQTATLTSGTLGYEWDEDIDNGSRPAGMINLSTATYSGVQKIIDLSVTLGIGTATHRMTLYRHASGALVFGAGTVQYSWGLDSNHDRGSAAADVRLQQATVNLFADMGVQPGTLQSGLVSATQSADYTPPTSQITSPAAGTSFTAGTVVTITGTASDSGGGVVGAVEVSVDGGATWHPASGRESWSVSWTPTSSGPATIRSRAIDDSGNIEGLSSGTCPLAAPCSLWTSTATPALLTDPDPTPSELGVKFTTDVGGMITALRFYKSPNSTGAHVGRLWTATGTLLASVTFTNETASGWQQANLATPVAVTANTTYVASYQTTRYAVSGGYFNSAYSKAPLRAPSTGTAGGNGVYILGTGFPTNTYNAENYWVDVVFTTATDAIPPTVIAVSPANSATGVAINTAVTVTFSETMNISTITASTVELRNTSTNALIASTVSYNATTRVATLTPSAALAGSTGYTGRVLGGTTDPRVKDMAGNAMSATFSSSFTTADATPPTVTSVSPANSATGVATNSTVTVTFSEAMSAATITTSTIELRNTATNALITSTVSYNATTNVATLTPSAALAGSTGYTVRVLGGTTDPRAKDAAGNALAATFSSTFTTVATTNCPCSLWSASTVPSGTNDIDSGGVELGVKFRSDVSGYITGLRFYKASGATSTHGVSLWSSMGTLLASATSSAETASGWQQVNLASPVAISANTTYLASYFASDGRYFAATNYFNTTGVDNGFLHAQATGTAGGNGVYRSNTTGFPNQTYSGSNYWVDVVFTTTNDSTPPSVAAVSPANSATGAAISTTVTVTFSEAMDVATISTSTIELRNTSTNALITSTVSYNASTNVATLTPSSALAGSTGYTIRVLGGTTDPRVKDLAGNALATTFTSTFTTVAVDTTAPTVTAVSPANSATGVATNSTVTVTFSEAMDAATISTSTIELRNTSTNVLIISTVSYNASTNVATLTPSSALTGSTGYTIRVLGGTTDPRVKDLAGNALAATFSATFTTIASFSCPCSLWSTTTVPTGANFADSFSAELGVQFRADVSGYITGLRFYKGTGATNSHSVNLWSSTGTLLASAISSGETASGWQQVNFAAPVAINANTIYVASYFIPDGRYFAINNYFATTGVDNGPLHAPVTGAVTNGNGVYRADTTGFPNQTFSATNYWVDAVFALTIDTTAPTVTAVSPASSATGVATNSTVTVTFSEAMSAATITTGTIELRNTSTNALIISTVSYTASTNVATLTPSSALSGSTGYTVRVLGGTTDPRVKDVTGNALAATFTSTFTTADITAPTVTAVSPANNATGVATSTAVTVTFSEAMDAATITTGTIELRNTSTNALIASTVSYNASTNVATLTPSAALAGLTGYTIRVLGGAADPRVKDAAGNALAAIFSSTFTTVDPFNCPCRLWNSTTTPSGTNDVESVGVELGVKFRSDVGGYITALRFYKSAGSVNSHGVKLWSSTGTLLASATSSAETASAWQQVNLATPVAISANTTYVVSYFASDGRYFAATNYFTSTGVDNGPLHAQATGAAGGNGVYRPNTTGFPNQTYSGSNYWVDVVFETTVDLTPPMVAAVNPVAGATAVPVNAAMSITFSEDMNPATITASTVELRNATTNALIASTLTYNSTTRLATLTPSAPLGAVTSYTLRVLGGTTDPRAKDLAGNALAATFTATFTTAADSNLPIDQGPGGPILVVTTSSNPFSRYYAEILRAEGLNAFASADIASVTATMLSAYDVVILGEMALTSGQVTMFSNWVTNGGNLIAMKPDKQLAGLLGLTDAASTLSEGYLLVNTASTPGNGIVNQTMQFHGILDRYLLNGASSVATLYSNATTATSNPAVTLRSVGTLGGQAAAFTYDLARSIIYTRQGNPAWAGQERDGSLPKRSNDLFFGPMAGNPQPDWIDLNKVAIPQADEQQRLLANLIIVMNQDKKPLPRFWYLPEGLKAALLMTGDDHGNGGTVGRWNNYVALSPAGCSVDSWDCVRGTSYIYPNTPMSDAQAAAYQAQGFEVALHVTTSCADYTATTLANFYTTQLGQFASAFPSVGASLTNRTHCVVWSDWASQAKVELANGIRLDTNYYYWPGSWIMDRPGFMTGSGMPMRFADSDGTMIDVYQAATQMTDESTQSYPLTVDALLDRALGAEGYYGVFTANIHTDVAQKPEDDAIIASALARGVPVVSAKQVLKWIDGRNSSSFGSMSWSGSTLNFTITPGTGSLGLIAMIPTAGPSGNLSGVTLNGNPVSYATAVIKGVTYATIPAALGNYQAAYTAP